ncbi:MAG: MMPL family transporter [Asgard group archaeon]|nr:MMPL family transporter [Asgard group archaeon]
MLTKFIDRIVKKIKSKLAKKEEIPKEEDKKKKPIFKWLGEFITKRYKLILLISVLCVVAAIYPALRLQGQLKYNDRDFLPTNLESDIGESILQEEFHTNTSRQTTIIILDSEELIGSPDNINYLQKLIEEIDNSDYSDVIARKDSIISACDEYNATFWNQMNEYKDIVYDMVYENITYANDMIYDSLPQLQTLTQQVAGLYLMTWFNFSRTYYFGLYDADLYTYGPENGLVLFTIEMDTNFASGFEISSDYVQLVYDVTMNSLDDYRNVNDQVLNQLAFDMSNSLLYSYSGLSLEDYQKQVHPILEYYYQNWLTSFQSIITNNDMTIVDGTDSSNNIYEHATIFNAYLSQGDVINYLLDVNATTFETIDMKDIIVSQAGNFFDFSNSEMMDLLTESEIQEMIGAIYDLGANPTQAAKSALAEDLTDQIFEKVLEIYSPIESYEEFCNDTEYNDITKWVLSEDKKCTIVQIVYDVSQYQDPEEKDQILVETDEWIGLIAQQLIEDLNITQSCVYHTGEIIITENIMFFSEEATSYIDIIAVILVIVILFFIFKSVVAPFLPLVTIGIALAVSFAFLFWVSKAMDIHYMSTMLLSVVSLGAGVDYCIFIFSRYQEELKKGASKTEALKTAIEHAGESVFHSGLTVMVGFGALIIPNFPLLRSLGVAMVIGIGFSVIASILIIPSLIMLLGDAVFWPKALQRVLQPKNWYKKLKAKIRPSEEKEITVSNEALPEGKSTLTKRKKDDTKDNSQENTSFIHRLGRFVTKNGLAFFIGTLVVFTPLGYLTFKMKTSTDFMSMMPQDFPQREASNLLAERMSFGNPISVQILFNNINSEVLTTQSISDIQKICNQLISLDTVKTIRTVICPLGMTETIEVNGEINPDYLEIINGFIGESKHSFYLEIYLNVDQYSDEANDLVGSLPDLIADTIQRKRLSSLVGSEYYILGITRDFYEMNEVTLKSYSIVIPIVIIGVFLVLFFLFGSYFTPLRLILTIGMSIIFSLSMLWLIYGLGLGAPIFFLLPIMLFSILMGLGLDYDIFIVTRIKEYCEAGMMDSDAIVHALDHTATIITSCGFVMAAAFSSLMFTPLLHISELGFAFTLSILLDATFIRLILVPSIMVLAQKYNWTGPKRLQKVFRDPKVTAVMKVLGDEIGVEIYNRHFKYSLEETIKNSTNHRNASYLLDDMMPIITGFIDEEKITPNIIEQMKESLTKVITPNLTI